jgi:hypothetical protein
MTFHRNVSSARYYSRYEKMKQSSSCRGILLWVLCGLMTDSPTEDEGGKFPNFLPHKGMPLQDGEAQIPHVFAFRQL